jgi:xanthine dehydrogenase/oxidase|eukprot:Stramenopile-MAST_4_protein_1000
MSSTLFLCVNGQAYTVQDAQPEETLLSFLRRSGWTGAKLGCGEGGCGACTVMVSQKHPVSGIVEHRSVNACLAPLCSVDGAHVVTVEGIVDEKTRKPHPVQERIAKFHGSQCGFCTPGIVMSMYTLLQNNPKPKLVDIEDCFDGNLCRCTGYRPIIDAGKSFAVDKSACPCPSESIEYKDSGTPESEEKVCGGGITSTSSAKISDSGNLSLEYEATGVSERPFPDELKSFIPRDLKIEGERITWFRPVTMKYLLEIKAQHPDAKIIAGNTEVGIETKFKNFEYPKMINAAYVGELKNISVRDGDGSLVVGGGVTLTELQTFINSIDKTIPKEFVRGWLAAEEMIRWFASNQIRNVASLAGNICTASPISDMNPVLIALGASVCLASVAGGNRIVPLRKFFLGYRKVDIKPDEVLVEIIIPRTSASEYVCAYKQARRRDDDISIVNACFRVQFDDEDPLAIVAMHAAYGGMAAVSKAAENLETAVCNEKRWTNDVLKAGLAALQTDFNLPDNVPGGMPGYRQTLASSLFYKFFIDVSLKISSGEATITPPLEKSGAESFLGAHRPVTHGVQNYDIPTGGIQRTNATGGHEDHDENPVEEGKSRAPVGQPLVHRSAVAQCTGEAKYTDDIPSPPGTLFGALVLSSHAHAEILSIDASKALSLDGVVRFFSAKDLEADENEMGPVLHDEELFRSNIVQSTGQMLGFIVAETDDLAKRAARLVEITYKDLPTIISIDDAIAAKSFHPTQHLIEDGDVDDAFATCDIVLEGEMRVGGQEHFYLECNSALVVPGEGDELYLYCSTQNPTKAQNFAARACGVTANKVVCKMKRMGGGFGGKETRSVFLSSAVALAAHALRVPVRTNLDRDVDMWITGGRHPFIGKYKVGAMKSGKVVAVDVQLYNNGGYSLDLTEAVMDRALFHMENAYKIPNVRAKGYVCFTNTTSNTAFRGFGGPQGMMIAEAYMEHVASALKMSPEQVRSVNLYGEGDRTHFGQIIERNPLPRLMQECSVKANFEERQRQIASFNAQHRWKKRGISMIPTKFGIAFTATFMNQAGALVNIYTDGTVLVTHGGTEMGQGLHTKILQIAAKALAVSMEHICITETATDKVPNSSPTAASASSDLYGMAVLHACETLAERLAPFRKVSGVNGFKDAVNAAYFNRVNLSAQGFYKMPVSGYDYKMETKNNWERGKPFAYFTFGVACSEVEIDVLTGDMRILRTDIVMDVGNSLNPAIDIGQIEGAYTQGVGLCTMEEVVWGGEATNGPAVDWLKPGTLFTRGPGTYKIPSFNDVPIDFRVTLLKDNANPAAVHSSRAIGEPPLFLGTTVFFALKRAISSARQDAGIDYETFSLDSPLTSERIRMSCGDDIAERFGKGKKPNGFW